MKHILMLFTDQQRFDTISALGNPGIQTPNLDALAADSVVFEHAYTPSPVCVPARLSMFSGQYPARTGCCNNNRDKKYQGDGFYGRITEGGFESACIGKMHYVWDPYGKMGFNTRISQEELSKPEDDYTRFVMEHYPHIIDYMGMRSEMYYVPQISPFPAKDHPTGWIGEQTVKYIEDYDPEKPLFLVSSFIAPHPPYCPPAPWQKLYREDPAEPLVPEKEALEDMWELIGDRCSLRRHEFSHQDILRTKNFYYAGVSFVDYQIGRIIQALKDKGMYEDTLILFASDHGDMMGDYAAIGKRTMVESSSHIPFMIKYPGKEPGRRQDPCSLVDVAPTLLGFAGAAYAREEFDGIDLFGGETHEYVYSQHGTGKNGTYMVTDGSRKLVYSGKSGRYFYFDTLPEMKNVYDENRPEVKELKALLDAYRAGDRNPNVEGSITAEPVTKKHPHYPGRMDHRMRHADELAMIPEGYTIDLE